MERNTLELQRLEKSTIFHTHPSEDGLRMEKLDVNKHKKVEKESTTSKMSTSISTGGKNLRKRKREEFVMQESQVITRKKILKDKSKFSKKNTQITKSSKILDLDSTGKERDLKPFWTQSSKEWSKKSWLPTKIGCVDLDMNSLSRSVKNIIQGSWFSAKLMKKKPMQHGNCQKICCQSSQFSLQEIMDCVQEKIERKEKKLKKKKQPQAPEKKKRKIEKKKEVLLKTRKIRIYPIKQERELLRKWMGSTRWTYNKCLDFVKKKEVKLTKKSLRAKCLNSKSKIFVDNPWLKETPYDIRDEGMNDLLKAYKINFKVHKGKKIFNIKFRSRKDNQQSIVIHHKHYKHKKGLYAFIKNIKTCEKLPEVKHDFRIVLDRLGRYYMCIPIEVKQAKIQSKTPSIISFDPGVRTFMTGYDVNGKVLEFGNSNDNSRIFKYCLQYDKYQSIKDKKKFKGRTKRNFRKKMLRIREKIRNLIKDLHFKLSKFLCINYKQIIIPEFKTKNMVNRMTRKINSKTARTMLTWSHYLFRQRLIHKAKEYKDRKVIITTEEYTSQTCGVCGKLNKKLGRKEIFKCSSRLCLGGFEMGRDVNASRNVLIKFLSDKNPIIKV